MSTWFEDESFWRETYLVMFSEESFRIASEQVDGLLALTGIQSGAVLDLCCGPGRHVVPLALKGFQVTAVDLSPFLLSKAQDNAHQASVNAEFVLEDMRTFCRPGTFDLALSMFTSFGYFDQRDEDRQVLGNLRASLRTGGTVLMDLMSKEVLARVFQPTLASELADGTTRVARHQIVDDWTRIRNEWLLIREGTVRRFDFTHRIYSGQELSDLLIDDGFNDVRLYGDLDGRAYGIGANRLIAVARAA